MALRYKIKEIKEIPFLERADYFRKQENKDQMKGDTPHHVRTFELFEKNLSILCDEHSLTLR